jgi:hypothetical protein
VFKIIKFEGDGCSPLNAPKYQEIKRAILELAGKQYIKRP